MKHTDLCKRANKYVSTMCVCDTIEKCKRSTATSSTIAPKSIMAQLGELGIRVVVNEFVPPDSIIVGEQVFKLFTESVKVNYFNKEGMI